MFPPEGSIVKQTNVPGQRSPRKGLIQSLSPRELLVNNLFINSPVMTKKTY